MSNFDSKIVEKIHIEDLDLTWLEIMHIIRKSNNKVIGKNLLICQGDKEKPSIIFLTKNYIKILIEELQKVYNEL